MLALLALYVGMATHSVCPLLTLYVAIETHSVCPLLTLYVGMVTLSVCPLCRHSYTLYWSPLLTFYVDLC